MMTNCLPADIIRTDVLRRLRVQLLAQSRLVSKELMTLIDSEEFKNIYHVNNPNPLYHLLVCHQLNNVQTYTSIVQDNTSPQPQVPLTTPDYLLSLRNPYTLASDAGLSCFYGDRDSNTRGRAVILNPIVRKCVNVVFPIPKKGYERTIVGFGVCPSTSHPKLVKICVNSISRKWLVEVFTFSKNLTENTYEGAWENVYDDNAFADLIDLECAKVSANGVIYFRGYDNIFNYAGRSNFVILFDLKSFQFAKVDLPEKLVKAKYFHVAKVNESLGLLEYYVDNDKSGMHVCGVWTKKDGAYKPFTKLYTIKVKGKPVYGSVLGFMSNGEVILELDSELVVYTPSSDASPGSIRRLDIDGTRYKFSVTSLIETPYFLDQPASLSFN